MKKIDKLKIVVAVSGAGRSLENLILYSKMPDAAFEIVGVISSKIACRAESVAQNENIPLLRGDFSKHDKKLAIATDSFLSKTKAGLIVLAGFLKPFPVLPQFQNKTINIHPALLPKYGGKGMYGMKVHAAVFANHEKTTGATVHLVNEEYDKGQIIAQIVFDIKSDDSAEIIANKVFECECLLLPFIISKIARKELSLSLLGKHSIYKFEDLKKNGSL
ncbi:MAG: hypothetical protein KBD78_12560 [Oligoflexales bacterium]|nr:hypothetical protein [Oligoflexales bacterium]